MTHMIADNEVSLLECGARYFPALIDAINGAARKVALESYIFADDDSGRAVANALIEAAARGVDVRVLIDGFGSHDTFGELDTLLKNGNVKVAVFRPERSRWRFRKSRLRRMHRKLVVVDDEIAFVGGINVIDDLNMEGHTNAESFSARYDFAVRVKGGVAREIAHTMSALWRRWFYASGDRSVEEAALHALEKAGAALPQADDNASKSSRSRNASAIAFVHRDNWQNRKSIEREYVEAINSAKHDILIANAYFFPGHRLLGAIKGARQRGVQVRLLLQGRREYFLQHYASRALYDRLLNKGVEIAEYHASFLHAKVAVVDSKWATVGSSNIDPFSLLLAREANIVVRDEGFAVELKSCVEKAWADASKVVARERWLKRPILIRIKSALAYNAARFLLRVFGFGGH